MAKPKRKTLPKDFKELLKTGDIAALTAVFEICELSANNGFAKETALHFRGVPNELVRWLVARGLDVNIADHYGKTPLYTQAYYGTKTVGLLLELGADVNRPANDGRLPLHTAAINGSTDIVKTLIAHGADIHAEDKVWHRTPLAEALASCSGSRIALAGEVADILLGAGAHVTPEMRQSVSRIGKDFEFHRGNFSKDLLPKVEAGLARLYALFNVEPVPRRRLHDGISLITVSSEGWKKQHGELWEALVPSQGKAQTVQGEVVRITGRISDEIYRNGGANWDADYRKMLDALLVHLASGTPLSAAETKEAAALSGGIRSKGDGDDDIARLCELAVRWVLRNPQPDPLGETAYKR